MIRMMPMLTAIGAGALDGVVQNSDEAGGRTELATQYGTWYETGLFAGGIVLDMMRMSPELAETLWTAGGALLAKRLAEAWITLTVTPGAYAVPQYAPQGFVAPAARSFGFVNKQPSMGLV